MITQENQPREDMRTVLARKNSELGNRLHTIGIEAAQALDWENEATWKNALQRIAALARAQEATR